MRRERNQNNKRASCAQLATTVEKTKGFLYPKSRSSGLAIVADYNHAYTTKGVKQLIAMLVKNCDLKLVVNLHGYEVEVQQQVIEKMF